MQLPLSALPNSVYRHSKARYSGGVAALPLSALADGATCRIVALNCSGAMRSRLLAFGFVRGAHLTIIRRAPLGDPIEIALLGFRVAIRKETARCIRVRQW